MKLTYVMDRLEQELFLKRKQSAEFKQSGDFERMWDVEDQIEQIVNAKAILAKEMQHG